METLETGCGEGVLAGGAGRKSRQEMWRWGVGRGLGSGEGIREWRGEWEGERRVGRGKGMGEWEWVGGVSRESTQARE